MCAPVHDRVTFKHTCAVNSIGLHCDQVISQEYIIGSLSSAYGQPQAWPYAILSSDLGLLVTVWAGLFTLRWLNLSTLHPYFPHTWGPWYWEVYFIKVQGNQTHILRNQYS